MYRQICAAVILMISMMPGTLSTNEAVDNAFRKCRSSRRNLCDAWHVSDEGFLMTVDLDMKMDMKQLKAIKNAPTAVRQKREAPTKMPDYKWKNGEVHYQIRTNDFNDTEERMIREAISEWEKYTCLKFNETDQSVDKVSFERRYQSCFSKVGRVGGVQAVNLGPVCMKKPVILHEIGHVIGRLHEHARPDRDHFVRVNKDRLQYGLRFQFQKSTRGQVVSDDTVQYDYRSIMHYSGNVPIEGAMEPLESMYKTVIGRGQNLSFRDIHLTNLMYRCADMFGPEKRLQCYIRADSFLFFLNGQCQCLCPGDDTDPVVVCNSTHAAAAFKTTPAPATIAPLQKEAMVCEDMQDDCDELKRNGSCTMDMEHMFMYCQKTCGFCAHYNMCMDYDPSCPMLAMNDMCNHSVLASFMKMQCQKSCNFCKRVDPCEMQKKMGLAENGNAQLDVPQRDEQSGTSSHSGSGRMHSAISTTGLGLLYLVWIVR